MRYKNASQILPDELLKEVQKYASGEAIYIPNPEERKKWGEGSGARAYYRMRNAEIRKQYKEGTGQVELAKQYGLSVESIRRILYKK